MANFKGWTAAHVENIQGRPKVEEKPAANFFQQYDLFIGIDGGTSTGFAVWLPKEKRFMEIVTTDFWGAIDRLQALSFSMDKKKICVVVEDPAQIKYVHISKKTNVDQGELRKIIKIAQDVGGVKRESRLLLEWLDRYGWNSIAVKPTKHTTGKGIKAEQFNARTGWKGKSSDHSRDAALLVYGR